MFCLVACLLLRVRALFYGHAMHHNMIVLIVAYLLLIPYANDSQLRHALLHQIVLAFRFASCIVVAVGCSCCLVGVSFWLFASPTLSNNLGLSLVWFPVFSNQKGNHMKRDTLQEFIDTNFKPISVNIRWLSGNLRGITQETKVHLTAEQAAKHIVFGIVTHPLGCSGSYQITSIN